ncbi:hypothetical protein D3C87_1763550 [compost metagenome]
MADITLFQRRNADLFGHAAYGFFQRQIHVVAQVRAACRALTTTATAEDITENIAKDVAEISATATKATAVSAAAHAALFKRRMTVLIVGCTFLSVGQDLIRFFDLFKFGFGLFVTLVTVRVKFHGQALVRLFDFTLFRCFRNA